MLRELAEDDDLDILCEGRVCYLGHRRIQHKTVRQLLQVLCLREECYGNSQYYTINDTGRAVLRRPRLVLEISEALIRMRPFTINKDDKLVYME